MSTILTNSWGVLVRCTVAAARRSRHLAPLMTFYPFRKLLGASGRGRAWRAPGAEVGANVTIGPRVTMRFPDRVSIKQGSSLGGRVNVDSWAPISIGANVLMNGDIDLLSAQHDVDSPDFVGDAR